jgi:ADP-ribose pyrophosphatase YjhB (NUDIX family)
VTTLAGDYTATLPRKRMGSGVFRDVTDRVLLVEPTYKDYWELLGGAVDGDESPHDAARREVEEELGFAMSPGRLLVVDWVLPRPGRAEGVMFVYDGGVLDAKPPRTSISQRTSCAAAVVEIARNVEFVAKMTAGPSPGTISTGLRHRREEPAPLR